MDQHAATTDSMSTPLSGMTVVALEQAVAAPFATRQLADLGARVIKVERPDGGDFAREYDHTVDGESSYFVWLNRGKQSVRLDLKDAADVTLIHTMLDEADIFVQNLAPGAVERLGLDPVELRRTHPRLITCSISGFGPGGPMELAKAYDLLIQCESGMLSVTGTPDELVKVGVSIVDIAAGMYAYTGLLTALLHRTTTGRGTHVEVSMLEAIGEWMLQPHLFALHGGQPPRRSGARHASIAPYGPFRVGDGGQVFFAVQSDREWIRLCQEVLDAPMLAADPRFATNDGRSGHVDVLTELIEQQLLAHTRESLTIALRSSGIATAELRSVADLAEHPQLQARSRWQTSQTPHGEFKVLRPPATIDGVGFVVGDVPGLGEHDGLIRAEFGIPRAT